MELIKVLPVIVILLGTVSNSGQETVQFFCSVCLDFTVNGFKLHDVHQNQPAVIHILDPLLQPPPFNLSQEDLDALDFRLDETFVLNGLKDILRKPTHDDGDYTISLRDCIPEDYHRFTFDESHPIVCTKQVFVSCNGADKVMVVLRGSRAFTENYSDCMFSDNTDRWIPYMSWFCTCKEERCNGKDVFFPEEAMLVTCPLPGRDYNPRSKLENKDKKSDKEETSGGMRLSKSIVEFYFCTDLSIVFIMMMFLYRFD